MDLRSTFQDIREVLDTITDLLQRDQKAALIIDKDGLTRVEGFVTRVDVKHNIAETEVSIDSADSFLLEQVIAVNGIFRSDYSEC